MKTFHLCAPDPRLHSRPIFTVSKISEPTNTADPISSTPPDEPTPEKTQLTPAPETPAARPPDATSIKRLLFETMSSSHPPASATTHEPVTAFRSMLSMTESQPPRGHTTAALCVTPHPIFPKR
ncbi:hypothetical protein L1987_03789 [Smallanthus sonchifolius]|uniref:Uncharacterized protein n=1 Tax=Smallanthus sonchifolius TaxID=185202 RepID=A0ACB9KBN1_9ASTR|nr:hypothetical protein L1987_03789 [Smallanthus sonchifolius]